MKTYRQVARELVDGLSSGAVVLDHEGALVDNAAQATRMVNDPGETRDEGLIRVEVTGPSPDLWRETRLKLIHAVVEVIESVVAEARLTEARSQASERDFSTAVKQLRVALGLTKAILVGKEGEEALLLGRQIEAMLVAIEEVADRSGAGRAV